MWDDPNQPPPPRYSDRQPPRNPLYGSDADGGFGNAPTERFPGPAAPTPYGPPNAGNAGYDPNDPYDAPPPYQPQPPRYPGGRPPQWPGPDAQRPPRSPVPPRPDPAYAPPPRQRAYYDEGAPAYAPPRAARPEAAPRERRRASRQPRSLPHLPIAHVFLIAGVLAMGYAVSQPWGVDASGTQLFIRDFSNAQLSARNVDAGALAVRAAYALVAATAVLSVALILLNALVTILNKMLGVIGLSGCASLAFFPVLWGAATLLFLVLLAGAGFAGIGSLSNLPLVQNHGFALVAVQQNAIGLYLWVGGLAAVFIGMLGQLVLRRR
ncbi:MAG: hypothetical protein ACRDHP_16560 [Ktedonobacterales bacterium]